MYNNTVLYQGTAGIASELVSLYSPYDVFHTLFPGGIILGAATIWILITKWTTPETPSEPTDRIEIRWFSYKAGKILIHLLLKQVLQAVLPDLDVLIVLNIKAGIDYKISPKPRVQVLATQY